MIKAQLIFGDYRLDLTGGRLWRDDRVIALRPKTFDVLCYLVAHRGELVTRAQLLEAVWANAAVSVTMPSISVGELRKALDDDAQAPRYIETAHGRGYRFVAAVNEVRSSANAREAEVSPQPALIGREQELGTLRACLERVHGGDGGAVLISGAAGIGKSRLAAEVQADAVRGGMLVLSGNCYDREDPLPLGPLVEILELILQRAPDPASFRARLGADASEISRLLPQLHRLIPGLAPPMNLPPLQSQRMLFNAVAEFLKGLAADAPLLIRLEDLHWADPGTLALFDHLARRAPDAPILLLATYRDDEVDARHPLARLIEELRLARMVETIGLRRLAPGAVAALAGTFTRRDLPASLVRAVDEITGGNPFYIDELFRHFAERGIIASDDQMRRELSAEPLNLPRGLQSILERRLERLNPASSDVLAGAAVLGRSFPFALLEAVVAADGAALLEALDSAERNGLLLSAFEHPDTCFQFSHELIRQAVLRRLPTLRRQQLHLKIAAAIQRIYADTLEAWTGELAHHLWNAGRLADAEMTLSYLEKAGSEAGRNSANSEAVAYFVKALQLLATLPESPHRDKRELSLQIALGVPLTNLEAYGTPRVEKLYQRAEQLCERIGDSLDAFPILMALHIFHQLRAQYLQALDVAQRALSLAEIAGQRSLLIEGHRAVAAVLGAMGRHRDCLNQLERSQSLYDAAQDASAEAYGLDAGSTGRAFRALMLCHLGFPEQALAQRDEALQRAHRRAHAHSTAVTMELSAWIAHHYGDISETFRRASEAANFATEHEILYWRTRALVLRGWARAKLGESARGIGEIESGLQTYDALGVLHFRPLTLALLAEIYADNGETDKSLALLLDAQRLIDLSGERFAEPEVARLHGETILKAAQARGITSAALEAEKYLRRAITIAQGQEARLHELRAATSLARLLADQRRRPEARAVLSKVYGCFTEGFDTPVLRAARSLLDDLGSPHSRVAAGRA